MNMKTKKFSFVVPVYNAEKYLKKCIESIILQSDTAELILIDDGSTDESGIICDEYASEHENVSVFHTENGGVSNARNLGVDRAIGEYIIFVDSDDFIAEDFIKNIEKSDISSDADVIFFNTCKYFEEENNFVPVAEGLNRQCIHNKSKGDVLLHISDCLKLPASPWGKIIKRSFLLENKIEFPDIVGEDIDYLFNLLYYGKHFDMLEFTGYFYRIRTDARHSSGRSDSVDGLIYILDKWSKRAENYEFGEYLRACLAYEYAMLLHYYGALGKKDKQKYTKVIRNMKYLFDYGKGKKVKAIKTAVNCLGIKLTGILLCKYLRVRDGG